MAEIKQTFFQECEELLAELERGLLAIGDGDRDPETVNAVFRAVHSIKGGAGAFGLEELVPFAHVFETALDGLRAGSLQPSRALLETMLRAADALADLVLAARYETSGDSQRIATLTAEMRALDPAVHFGEVADEGGETFFTPVPIDPSMFDESGAAAARLNSFTIRIRPKPALYAKANETALLIRELAALGDMSVVCDASDLPLLQDLDPEGGYLTWIVSLNTPHAEAVIRDVFEFVESDCDLDVELCDRNAPPRDAGRAGPIEETPTVAEAGGAGLAASSPPAAVAAVADIPGKRGEQPVEVRPPPPAARDAAASIRVDLERVDRMINLVGELVINQAMLAQKVQEAGLAHASAIAAGLDELEHLTREIQDSVMAIRAQPVKSVFQRMPRLVREVAAMTGKSVRLLMEGENTEVDKTVIERIADPLTHMVRNAIDHGLEAPNVRRAAGKPEQGLVQIAAMHRSGRIVIEVSDDGAGIDRARVKALAAQKSLIAADALLTDEETDNLIFLPGFSTAASISDISGRGVGMDVVRRSIQSLGGRISIQSRPGTGSTFTMSLPLTLAVLDGMVVTVGDQTLVVPLTAIVETLQPETGNVFGFGGDSRVIAIRDQFTPLIDVGPELGYHRDNRDASAGVALLVESEGGARSALLVDAILGQRQVVIKSLEANYQRVPGIAAATILGDGRVALILDVDAVVASSRADAPAFERVLAKAG
jgi:two-component system chemotaxis sensor kinase CheA